MKEDENTGGFHLAMAGVTRAKHLEKCTSLATPS